MSGSLLLDTNVLIWTISSSNRISARARRAISRSAASLAVSVVSVWEIVLKHQAGKLRLHAALEDVVDQILYRSPWTILPMVPGCLQRLASADCGDLGGFVSIVARGKFMLYIKPGSFCFRSSVHFHHR